MISLQKTNKQNLILAVYKQNIDMENITKNPV